MSEKQPDQGKLEFWAILELFGHQKIAGFVREVSLGGDAMLRVDVPAITYTPRTYAWAGDPPAAAAPPVTIPAFTKFYSPKSVFAMTPVSEETARAAMQSFRAEPVSAFELRALPAPAAGPPDDEDDGREFDDGGDEDDGDRDDDGE